MGLRHSCRSGFFRAVNFGDICPRYVNHVRLFCWRELEAARAGDDFGAGASCQNTVHRPTENDGLVSPNQVSHLILSTLHACLSPCGDVSLPTLYSFTRHLLVGAVSNPHGVIRQHQTPPPTEMKHYHYQLTPLYSIPLRPTRRKQHINPTRMTRRIRIRAPALEQIRNNAIPVARLIPH
jgi:hypothetical protein